MPYITTFYAINPNFKPIPTHVDLICAKSSQTETIDISVLYDPFNIDVYCTRFLAWLEVTPNSLPLYIYKSGDSLLITLSPTPPENYSPHTIPVIYVIKDVFTFSNSYGRCVPDPESKLSIDECMVLYNKNILEQKDKYPDILSYIGDRYGTKSGISGVLTIFFLVGALCLGLLLFIKNEKSRRRKAK
jgi:hypothetical protein